MGVAGVTCPDNCKYPRIIRSGTMLEKEWAVHHRLCACGCVYLEKRPRGPGRHSRATIYKKVGFNTKAVRNKKEP